MPGKPKYKKRKRKRKFYNVKNRGLSTKLLMGKGMTPLGTTLKVNMKYNQVINLNAPTAGIPAVQVYSANGMYDPDHTGPGHQPRGFDQLVGTLYDHYTVIASSIQVTFANLDAVNPQICGIAVKDNTTPIVSVEEAMESPDCVYDTLGALVGGGVKTLRRSLNPNKWLGSGGSPLSNPQLRGSAGNNPAEDIFFNVFVAAADGGTDPAAVSCNVVINYTAILTEPKNPVRS